MITDNTPTAGEPDAAIELSIEPVMILTGDPTWGGTSAELDLFMAAVHAYRTCPGQDCCVMHGLLNVDCPTHSMTSDQPLMDRLMMQRRRWGSVRAQRRKQDRVMLIAQGHNRATATLGYTV